MKAFFKTTFFFSLTGMVLLCYGCVGIIDKQTNLEKSNLLKEVFISRKDRKAILGKLSDGATIKVLPIEELPRELIFLKGTPKEYKMEAFHDTFRDAKLSPDKKYIAFSVESLGSEWSGIYDLTTKNMEVWNYFFDSDSGYLFWSPDNEYLAENAESLAHGYCITVGDFKTRKKILTISDEFLQGKGVKGLELKNIRKDNKEYLLSYKVKFDRWSKDSKRVFFRVYPECAYTIPTEAPLHEKQKRAKERKNILKKEKDLSIWSVDIVTQTVQKEK